MARGPRKARGRVEIPRHASFVEQFTCCGKGACRRCGGVTYAHGPYWYATWREPWAAKNPPGRPAAVDVDHAPAGSPGRQRSAYVGAVLPEQWMVLRVEEQARQRARGRVEL